MLSRRALLRRAGAAAVVGAVGWRWPQPSAHAAGASAQCDLDVAVVGGGIAGLTAAWRLMQAGRSVVVLEANDRVGGRMLRQAIGEGAYVDLGGQWVGPTQDRIIAVADELGVQRFPWYHDGDTRLVYGDISTRFHGNFPPFEGDPPPLPPAEVADGERAWGALEALAATVPAEAPWTAPNALELDHETLESWLDANTQTAFGRFVLTLIARIGGSGAFEPGEVSMLHMAWTQANAPQDEEPESELFVGAAGQIPLLIAAELGDSVILNAPVWGIQQDSSGVTLHSHDDRYRARFVVVAIPPTLAGAIHYDPPLPARRLQLTQRMPMGSLFRVNAIYPTAFWRDAGLNGVGTGDLPVAQFTADSSPPSGVPGIITTFVTGDAALRLGQGSAAERQAAVLADLTIYFGPAAGRPTQFLEKDWPADPRTGGAFTDFMAPGVWTGYGDALRTPVDRIYWAGTETATRWSGYFDGAVRSGEDAVAAILPQL